MSHWLIERYCVFVRVWKSLSALSPLTWFSATSSATHRVSQKWWDMQQFPRETETRQKGYIGMCACVYQCVCHREIKHNRYFQMTCWCPQRACHYLDCHGEVWASDWSQCSQSEDRYRGQTLRANNQSHSLTHWCFPPLGRKSYLLNTHTCYINTHTCTGGVCVCVCADLYTSWESALIGKVFLYLAVSQFPGR